ncbi:MAG: DoxX family protein [Dechloromonas sp.]|uniref:DoxX family protein n=1 Tax=Dechloromonas sp. TaxID=1917218 RepID=UPI0027E78028|nr:DoxX family protein [Dechloromonas sp.]MBT9519735.1 DoxX family protein [Dechloromonas sp.]
MNTSVTSPRPASPIVSLPGSLINLFSRIPDSLIALIGRFSIAAIFWKSGQTKIEGLAIDLVSGDFQFGWPHLSESALELFRSEYQLPLLPPELAAPMAAFGEHLFPILILLGLATRFSSLALLIMTMTIQIFVYPDAYPTHGVWAAVLLVLIARGPGVVSIDHWLAKRYSAR